MISKIQTNPFNIIYKITITKGLSLYIKRRIKPHTYMINGHDLSPVFKLDRLVHVRNFMSLTLNTKYRKYIDYKALVLPKTHIIVSCGYSKNEELLTNILTKHEIPIHISQLLINFSKEILLAHSESSIKYQDIFRKENADILDCKIGLEIINPLLKVFTKNFVFSKIKEIGPSQFLNHGDLQPKNIFYSYVKNGNFRIIDFEECFWGPFGWDIGFLWGNILTIAANTESFNTCKQTFEKLLKELDPRSNYNVRLFTLSTLLMRLYDFPLFEMSTRTKKRIGEIVEELSSKM